MSISSLTNPTALLSQVTANNPLAAATPLGAGSFVNSLLQELRQSGPSPASTSPAANATTATGALQSHAHRHHGGGMSQLISQLQQSQASGNTGTATAGSGVSSLQLQSLLQNLRNGSSATPGRLLSTAV